MLRRYIYNGIETDYLIGSEGTVYSEKTKKYLQPHRNSKGYMYVDIYVYGKRRRKALHQLVAETFISNINNKATVNHLDGDKTNNNKNNLRWATQSEQNYHAIYSKFRQPVRGESVHFCKYSETVIVSVCEYLMKNIPPLEIEALTGVPVKTIYDIRSKKTWKHISYQYDFPRSKYPNTGKYPVNFKDNIEQLLNKGYDNDAICAILDIEKTKSIAKMITDMRSRLKKVQRPSKDIYNFKIIE